MPQTRQPTAYLASPLPPHLHEVCALLARGLLRLRSRTAEEFARDSAETDDHGDIHLHFIGHQRGHAKPKSRRHE
jgi:hypothetical protein